MNIQSPVDRDKKFTVLVIYDITNDKRRNRMAKLLKGYGYRFQKSAFECRIDNGRYNRLISGITKIHDEGDLVRVYRLNELVDIKNWGEYIDNLSEDVIFL